MKQKLHNICKSPLLYVQIREHLRNEIRNGKNNEKLPSERELSERYDVNRITVRRALLDLGKEGFLVRHQGKGTFIKKVAPKEEKHLKGFKVIGVIVPDLELSKFAVMLKGMEATASAMGYRLWIKNAILDSGLERSILKEMGQEELAGIITAPVLENVLNPEYAANINTLIENGSKIVFASEYIAGSKARVAMVDRVKVGYIATEHLIMLGHRRISYLSTHTYDAVGNDAYRGYRMVLEDYRVDFDSRLEINIPVILSAEPAENAVRKMLSENPGICTAIATPQFSMAYGAYKALNSLGIKIDDDIALVGDDLMFNPEMAHLTYTKQPHYEEGVAAVKLLLQDMGKADSPQDCRKHVLIPPELVVGGNAGAGKNEMCAAAS